MLGRRGILVTSMMQYELEMSSNFQKQQNVEQVLMKLMFSINLPLYIGQRILEA